MSTISRLSVRLLALVPITALLAVGCSRSPLGITSPASLAGTTPIIVSTSTTPVALGSASSFVILGGPAVTTTRSAVIGNVGAGFTGAPVTQTLGSIIGVVSAGNAIAAQAYSDFRKAYATLGSTPSSTDPTHKLVGSLASVTLGPGVYDFIAAATLAGVLTLDARGDSNAVWIFKVGSGGAGALTATSFSVVMAGGGRAGNVSWWVADAVTMTTSEFQGNLLSGAAITFTGPGSFNGRALATAAVTLTDMIPFKLCELASLPTPQPDPIFVPSPRRTDD